MSFEIEEVAVNASTFFFIRTSQCSGLLGLLFGWINDTTAKGHLELYSNMHTTCFLHGALMEGGSIFYDCGTLFGRS
ncbi:hypothetical protein E2542_SST16629 [Spatholobus suberectus]|nr:hypothetical protein E2542_SST16629 [Spatholobus suberectus]